MASTSSNVSGATPPVTNQGRLPAANGGASAPARSSRPSPTPGRPAFVGVSQTGPTQK